MKKNAAADAMPRNRRKEVRISNLQKIYYPSTDSPKGEVIDYYIKISAGISRSSLKSPGFRETLFRWRIKGFFFYEKQCPVIDQTG